MGREIVAKIAVYRMREPKASDTVRFADNQHAPMATLTVKNVGPIREAEIEVKKHTIFIGPQGTGKSTLAKLIAIGGDEDILTEKRGEGWGEHVSFKKYNMDGYVSDLDSTFIFDVDKYCIGYEDTKDEDIGKSLFLSQTKELTSVLFFLTSYMPAERSLFPILSDSVWSLLSANINIPKSLSFFGKYFEEARNEKSNFFIPFLKIHYVRKGSKDLLYFQSDKSILLSQSASGYQSIIPLLLVVEHQRQQSQRRFIIEEPELNLYPTAQKDLIYSLVGGLDPEKTYQDAEWVITTHSPYVLTSYNTLMLAYKVAQRSDELRAEVDKIIPSRYWINPEDFAAYYVDNGTARSITSEKTGMINDSELDNVSEDFAGEQDQLLNLYRSVSIA